ncbi:MAG TPA: metal ABC transporter ATP-binding protein [Anaerolineaceae bacterium]|nr:metal ABC transporter ATP-binding protein [Anaerolineaceae bacterium]
MKSNDQQLSNKPDMPARMEVQGVSVHYGQLPVLSGVSFEVPHGGQVAVVGPNGAGKSTLFKALVGLIPIDRGQILIHGLPLGQHQDCVAYVPQREDVDWRFPVTVADVVMMGRYGKNRGLHRPGKVDHEIVDQALRELGIADLATRSIGELSGGQQQRAFIARALAQKPHILLMDEPFAGVDAATQETTLALLDRLHEQEVTVLVSTHDLDLAVRRFEKTLLLNHTVIAYGDSNLVFTPEALREAFSGQVLFVNGGAAVVDQCCPHPEHEAHPMEKRR